MKHAGTPGEVFLAFLRLGLTSFGGPVAHLGYFRSTFVERLKWLDAGDYAGLLSLCQFLPGPASSQAGFCIGLLRAGWLGGLAAWAGFTLPSALLMFGFAGGAAWFGKVAAGRAVLHGLQLAAVAVVAQAVWLMSKSMCPDLPRRLLAVLALSMVFLIPGTGGQIAVLLIGALAGATVLTAPTAAAAGASRAAVSHFAAVLCLVVFGVLLALSFSPWGGNDIGLAAAFYRTGALVFGGGHVVLPLLRAAIVQPGWVAPPLFLSGYGMAQAMPGPLFTVAAFYGAAAFNGANAATGAALALAAIFLPGLLLAAGVLPFWHGLRRHRLVAAMLLGVNAVVVGLLFYALTSLILHGDVASLRSLVIVLLALLALIRFSTPPIVVVAGCVLLSVL